MINIFEKITKGMKQIGQTEKTPEVVSNTSDNSLWGRIKTAFAPIAEPITKSFIPPVESFKKPTSIFQKVEETLKPVSKPMEFRVGEGMTPEQTAKAYEVIRKPRIQAGSEVRNPFAKETSDVLEEPTKAFIKNIAYRLPEIIPKVVAFTISNYKGVSETLAGETPKPLDLGFDARRLGFDEKQVKDTGTALIDDFIKREQENPGRTKTNIALSVLNVPISQVLDIWGAEAQLKTLAYGGLVATKYDPQLNQSLNRLGLTADNVSKETVKEAFKKEFQVIAQNEGGAIPLKQQYNDLVKSVQIVGDRYFNNGIPQLNKLGELIQDTSKALLKDITPEELSRIPIGLSIKDVSKNMPAIQTQAIDIAKQVPQNLQTQAQSLVTEIAKTTSISVANQLLSQLKSISKDPLIQEAKRGLPKEMEYIKKQAEGVSYETFKRRLASNIGNVERGEKIPEDTAQSIFSRLQETSQKGQFDNEIELFKDISNRKPQRLTGKGEVVVYRASPVGNLRPGDFVSIDRSETSFYMSPTKKVFTHKVKEADLVAMEGSMGGGKELIYLPKGSKPGAAKEYFKSPKQFWESINFKSQETIGGELPQREIGKPLISKDKAKLIQEVRKLSDENLKQLAGKIKQKDLTEEQFQEVALNVEFAREAIENNPAKDLEKYANKNGEIPETTGIKGKGIFSQKGDQIITELGFEDSEQARQAYQDYKKQKQQLQEIEDNLRILRKTKTAIKKGERLTKLAMGDRRTRLRVLKDRYTLTDNEVAKLRSGKDLTSMSQTEFNAFINKAEDLAIDIEKTRNSRIALETTIHEKDLRKWENMREAMKFPPISEMNIEQLDKLNEVLSQYKNADEFLSKRQIETIDRTELKTLRTEREVLNHLASKYNLKVENLPSIKPHQWMYDTQLARQHPFYDLLVDKYNISYLKSAGRVIELEQEMNTLIKEARKSQGLLEKFIPTDDNIVDWLQSEKEGKISLAKKMTEAELKAAQRQDEIYKDYYDWLVKRNTEKQFTSRFEDKYFPHTRRGFLEAWKEDGFLKGVKETFDRNKQEEAMLAILDEKTGDVLPYEKWVGNAQFRSGNLVPTRNAMKAFSSYIHSLEKARQFDEFIPEIMVYVQTLSPKEMTQTGLKENDTLQTFVKQWINSKKGRPVKQIITPGSKLDWGIKMGVAITRIRDLGLNLPVGISNIFGEQAGNIAMLRSSYPIGVARLTTPKGMAITKKYVNFVGETIWDKLTKASDDVGDKLLGGIFSPFGIANRKGNQIFLLGSMTKEEFAKGEISIERLASLRKKMGKYRVVEGAESVFGKSVEAQVGGQYKKWAIPSIISTASNTKKLIEILRKQGMKSALQSEEGGELFFSVIIGTIIGLGLKGYYKELEEDKDKNFVENIIYKSMRDALSMVGALNPKFIVSFGTPRLISFLTDIGEALDSIISLEEYKTGENKGKLKGVQQIKRTLTPTIISTITKENITPEEQAYKTAIAEDTAQNQKAKEEIQPVYDKIQKLKAEGKNTEAISLFDSLTKEQQVVYKKIKASEQTKNTIQGKKDIFPVYQKVQQLKSEGKNDEAIQIYDDLTDDQKRYYKLLKKQLQ